MLDSIILAREHWTKTTSGQMMNVLMIGLEPDYEKVGRITHFFPKAGVAVLELSATLNNGDKIIIRGSTTNVEQTIESMEIEHKQITTAGAGQSIGLKVSGRVRENDIVYKVRAP